MTVMTLPLIPGLPGLPDLNPLHYLSDGLKEAYRLFATFFEYMIVHPPRVKENSVLDYLGGNAIGLAGWIAVIVTAILTCISMYNLKRIYSVIEGIVISLFIVGATPLWLALNDGATKLGDVMSENAVFYHPPKNREESLVGFALDTDNPILIIAAFMPTGFFGSIMLGLVFAYEVYRVIFKYGAGLLVLALRPIGPRMAALVDAMVGFAIVTDIVGRPVMILSIEAGKLASDNILGGSQASLAFCVVGGFLVGLILQAVLFVAARRMVVKVTGQTASIVKGKVETLQRGRSQVDVKSVQDRRMGAMQPIPVYPVEPHPTVGQRAKLFASDQVKSYATRQLGKMVLQAGAGAASGGTTVAAGMAASQATSRRRTKPPQGPSAGGSPNRPPRR